MCLSNEHASVGQILFILKASRQLPHQLRTDAVLYKARKRQPVTLHDVRFCDLHLLRKMHSDVPGLRQLDQRIDITPIHFTEPVFRLHQATELDFLEFATSAPSRTCAPPKARKQWEYIADAEEEIMDGGSVSIEGVAGTGKTTLAQGIIERMRSLGNKCMAISKTRVASAKIDGNTAF